jgi:hypothetical protein
MKSDNQRSHYPTLYEIWFLAGKAPVASGCWWQ